MTSALALETFTTATDFLAGVFLVLIVIAVLMYQEYQRLESKSIDVSNFFQSVLKMVCDLLPACHNEHNRVQCRCDVG